VSLWCSQLWGVHELKDVVHEERERERGRLRESTVLLLVHVSSAAVQFRTDPVRQRVRPSRTC
jgi:hypothetical protein